MGCGTSVEGHSISIRNNVVALTICKKSAKVINILEEIKDQFDPNIPMNFRGDTLLHYAAAVGDVQIVKYLVKLPKLNKSVENELGQEAYNLANDDEIKKLLK